MPEETARGQQEDSDLEFVARARLPTRFGEFTIYGFRERSTGKEHTAMVHGEVAGKERCPVRVHSECHTGDVMGSLRCDCRDQLEAALRYVAAQEYGAVLYLRQEGRGIGLNNKIRAYAMQDLGFDTVEANTYLGFPEDARGYGVAAEMVTSLGIKSLLLMTNNPDKIEKLQAAGIPIVGRIPVVIDANPDSDRYLGTKRKRMRHML